MLKFFSGSRSVKPRAFLKQLSILLNAGIPLAKALYMSNAPVEVSDMIRSGRSFTDSLDTSVFPASVIAIISVGESSGNIAESINKACDHMEKRDSFRKKLVGSLIYPAFVLSLCIAAIFILTSLLLPSFAGIFAGLGVSLPPLSRFMMSAAGYLPILCLFMTISAVLFGKFLMSDRGLTLPLIGSFRQKLTITTFFATMAESLSSGMNIVDSLELASKVSASKYFKVKYSAIALSVTEGDSLAGAFKASGLFDEMVLLLVSAGEQASSLDKVFGQLTGIYEEDIENNIKTASSLVEPIATLAAGLVVGVIVFAMFLPIIKLIGILGG